MENRLGELEAKYGQLVWYARTSWNPDNDVIAKRKAEIKLCFPKEVEDLEGSQGDWHHGFNSGMLASVRLLSQYNLPANYRERSDGFTRTKQDAIAQAEEMFPFLDS